MILTARSLRRGALLTDRGVAVMRAAQKKAMGKKGALLKLRAKTRSDSVKARTARSIKLSSAVAFAPE